jgi:acyl-CoA dehydrogenase family protein 9
MVFGGGRRKGFEALQFFVRDLSRFFRHFGGFDFLADFIVCLRTFVAEFFTDRAELFAQKRIADIAIDLYAVASVMARVTRALEEKGEAACEFELGIAEAFTMRASRRIRGNFKAIDKNDDDQIKMIAAKVCDLGKYPFDTLPG